MVCNTKNILSSYGLCCEYDDFLDTRAMWIAELSNGFKVFQDDDRKGVAIPSAWIRLGHYLQDFRSVKIQRMLMRFGTHTVLAGEDQPYWFFSRSLLQSTSQTFGLHFNILGWPEDGHELMCTWYKLPELVVMQREPRPLKKCRPEQIIGLTDLSLMV